MKINIGIVGFGFVGSAINDSFIQKKVGETYIYDKFKNGGIGKLENLICTDVIFLCLPTPYDNTKNEYDKSSLIEVIEKLKELNYLGSIVIKSTVEPGTCEELSEKYDLQLIHNPEFLTARTAFYDFHNQNHVILGMTKNCKYENVNKVKNIYSLHYPSALISICTSTESEMMKLFTNCFYATKVQYFTELYVLCSKMNCKYENIKNLMLKNNWINPMHTNIPGPDGQISYGGLCFPKDTNALRSFMSKVNSPHKVLESVIIERNEMRDDNDNIN